jgi:hypothetical protein
MSWRVENNLEVYDGDRRVCECATRTDAARIVAAANAAEQITRLWKPAQSGITASIISADLRRVLDRISSTEQERGES